MGYFVQKRGETVAGFLVWNQKSFDRNCFPNSWNFSFLLHLPFFSSGEEKLHGLHSTNLPSLVPTMSLLSSRQKKLFFFSHQCEKYYRMLLLCVTNILPLLSKLLLHIIECTWTHWAIWSKFLICQICTAGSSLETERVTFCCCASVICLVKGIYPASHLDW